MAEAMFYQLIKDHHLEDQVQVSSAATSNYEIGNRPHPGAQKILRKYHLDDRGHTAAKSPQKIIMIMILSSGWTSKTCAIFAAVLPKNV